MMTPKTTSAPAAAPSHASDSAKQLASFASRTLRPSTRSRSSRRGRPFSHVELAFFTRPVAGEMAPGMPMPTVPRACTSLSIDATSAGDGPHRAVVIVAGRRDAAPGRRATVRRERDALDLRPAQVDADANHEATRRSGASPARRARRLL